MVTALANVGHCERREQDDHEPDAHDADGDPEDEVVALGVLDALEAVHLAGEVPLRVVQLGSQVHPEHGQQLPPRLGRRLGLRLGLGLVLSPRWHLGLALEHESGLGLEPRLGVEHGVDETLQLLVVLEALLLEPVQIQFFLLLVHVRAP